MEDVDELDPLLKKMNVRLISERVPYVWLPTPTMYEAWWPYVKNYGGSTVLAPKFQARYMLASGLTRNKKGRWAVIDSAAVSLIFMGE